MQSNSVSLIPLQIMKMVFPDKKIEKMFDNSPKGYNLSSNSFGQFALILVCLILLLMASLSMVPIFDSSLTNIMLILIISLGFIGVVLCMILAIVGCTFKKSSQREKEFNSDVKQLIEVITSETNEAPIKNNYGALDNKDLPVLSNTISNSDIKIEIYDEQDKEEFANSSTPFSTQFSINGD